MAQRQLIKCASEPDVSDVCLIYRSKVGASALYSTTITGNLIRLKEPEPYQAYAAVWHATKNRKNKR